MESKIFKRFEGDKVILIIVLFLMLISFLAIFSSTPMLPAQSDRLDTMADHGKIAMLGVGLILVIYKMKLTLIRRLSSLGFIISFVLLFMLLIKVNIPGLIKTEVINGAVRNFKIWGVQVHVFEIVKVAMVMYLAWAMNAIKGEMSLTNWIVRKEPRLGFLTKPFWKRSFYIYLPTLIISLMIFSGSGSSAIFVCAVLIMTMFVGNIPYRELILAAVVGLIGFGSMVAIYKISDGRAMKRVKTMISRINADYDMKRLEGLEGDRIEFQKMLDTLSQPVSARIAIHEGGLIGKGTGNSTQKYRVQNIYGDYMYSFLVEEYGMLGGIFILILFVSLLARCSIIARMCSEDFAKFAVGGLALLITGQAFMHILVNVGIGPMTGQTLPLISHGASAFVVFCIAFGIIISISRIAKKKIEKVENLTEGNMNALQDSIEKAAKLKE